jgi:prephenate dehydratase
MDKALTQNAAVELWYGARKQSAQTPLAPRSTGFEESESGTGMKIAIQGEPGSFSHEATLAMLPDAVIVPCSVSADVFNSLADEAVDGAVIPIENSLAGSVLEHFDLLLQHDVKVIRESQLRIRHNLIGIASTLDDIDRVFSHPVALAQCRNFLARHPKMESFAFYDTAGSVKQLVELRDRHAAAIASEAAARYYGA